MRNFFPIIFDSLFLFFASFVLSVVTLNYFLPFPYHVILSLSISSIISITGARVFTFRSNEKFIEKKDKKLFADTIIRLNLMKKEKLINLVISALKVTDAKITKEGFYDKQTDTLYITKFGFECLSKADIVKAFNQSAKKVVFLCQDFNEDIADFAQRFNGKIELKDGKYLFNLLKENNILPEGDFSTVYKEKNFPAFKKRILEKKNAKKFLFFGVAFCFLSWFVPYKIYYVVWGGVMISFAIYLKLFGKSTA